MGLVEILNKSTNGMSKCAHLLLISLILAGCNFSYDNAPTRKVNATELLGTWELTSSSGEPVKDVETGQHYDNGKQTFIITLKKDRTYSLKLTPENSPALPLGTGKWSLGDSNYYKGRHHYLVTLEKPRYISGADYNADETRPGKSTFEIEEGENKLFLCVDNVDASVCFERNN